MDATPGFAKEMDLAKPITLSSSNPDHRSSLNDPPPDSTIEVDERFRYETDDQGRVIKASATLNMLDLDHPRDRQAERTLVGKLPGDHAGHIFARIFQGPGPKINLTPMEGSKVNLSQYKTLENDWRRILEQGGTVEVSVSFSYKNDSPRPDRIRVRYEHPGGIERITIKNTPRQGASDQ